MGTRDEYKDASGVHVFIGKEKGFVPRALAAAALHTVGSSAVVTSGEVDENASCEHSSNVSATIADDTQEEEELRHEGWYTAIHRVTSPRSGTNTPRKPPAAPMAQPEEPEMSEMFFVDDLVVESDPLKSELETPEEIPTDHVIITSA